MKENTYTCKVCDKIKIRIKVGQYNPKTNKYQDDVGGCWNGRTCPDCNRARVRKKMSEIRKNDIQ